MMDPSGLGDEPHVRVTVTKTARRPLRRHSVKARNTITSTFSIGHPLFLGLSSQGLVFKSKMQLQGTLIPDKPLKTPQSSSAGEKTPFFRQNIHDDVILDLYHAHCHPIGMVFACFNPPYSQLSRAWFFNFFLFFIMKYLVLTAMILSAPGVWADWEQFEETESAVVYIDKERIQKNAQFPTIWQLTDLKRPNPRGILSNRVLLEFNCEERARRTIAFTSHKGHMAEGKPVFKSSQGGNWHNVQDDTVIAKIMGLVCEP